MTSSDSDVLTNLRQAREFLDAIEPTRPAYQFGIFTYVALRHNEEKVILRARLELSTEAPANLKRTIETLNFWAGQARFDVHPAAAETCIRCAVHGDWLPPVDGQLMKLLPKAPPAPSQGYDAYHEHKQPSYAHSDQSTDRLVLSGVKRLQLLSARMGQLQRELQDSGIDSVDELMRLYELRGSDETSLEIVATPVAALTQGSKLQGRHVVLGFRLAHGLQRERFNVTIRNADPSALDIPRLLNGAEVSWITHSGYNEAQWEFDLPRSEVIDCRVVYAGCVQAELRLSDPESLPNPRRTLVSLVDPQMTALEGLLTRPEKNQGRDFETGIAWLLQMLGFAPIHVSAMSNMTDEPDILVTTPTGEVLIVECTTGVPDDRKLTMLISRVARLREGLQRSNGYAAANAQVIAILITPLPREELAGIRAKAEKHGVLILCRPEIAAAIAGTRFEPNPSSVLQYWRGLGLLRLMTGEQPLGE